MKSSTESGYFSKSLLSKSGKHWVSTHREFREIKKCWGNCGLPVVCNCSCYSHKNITWVLLSKVDMHKMDCKQCHNIHSGVDVGLSVYLWWFNKCQCLWEMTRSHRIWGRLLCKQNQTNSIRSKQCYLAGRWTRQESNISQAAVMLGVGLEVKIPAFGLQAGDLALPPTLPCTMYR